jgi:hypothetical protein
MRSIQINILSDKDEMEVMNLLVWEILGIYQFRENLCQLTN